MTLVRRLTPFLLLLTDEIRNQKPRNIDIFYCVGTEEEAVFDLEISTLASRKSGITYHRYISDVDGHLDANKLMEMCNGVVGKRIMLCGPVAMMNSLASQLKVVGVKNKDIVFEDFNFK
ncbi:MAG: hypothetical protein UW41_C0003G0052 [Candidatus Collierbacteria bacterium GW2011_GWC2_44_18]|nr:MAG: hypothetical protein UW41_C0003G0052 [Candidatus Collierbacteria bacterium GW2011_GWC2_44_18]